MMVKRVWMVAQRAVPERPFGLLFGKKDLKRFKRERKDLIDKKYYVFKELSDEIVPEQEIMALTPEIYEITGGTENEPPALIFQHEIESLLSWPLTQQLEHVSNEHMLKLINAVEFVKMSDEDRQVIIFGLSQMMDHIADLGQRLSEYYEDVYDGRIDEDDVMQPINFENELVYIQRYLKTLW